MRVGLSRLVLPTLMVVVASVIVVVVAPSAASVVATVTLVALLAATTALGVALAKQLELVAVLGAVGVHIVLGAKKMVVLLGLTAIAAALVIRLHREHGRALALSVFALGLRRARLSVRVIVEKKASLFSLGTAVDEDEQLCHGVELVVVGELFAHLHVCDARQR